MKKFPFILFLFAAISLSAQTTYTVSSPDDDGTGTLRNMLSNIASGDIITIPADYVITLQSPIEIAKPVTINGQNVTIKTVTPGLSSYRLFVLGNASGSTAINIGFSGIKFQGGDVRLNSDVTAPAPSWGGAILILKRVNLTMNTCEVNDSKAVRGGAICVIDGVGFSSHINNCRFSGNNASEYAGALYFNRSQSAGSSAGETVVTNTVFEGNISALASAVKINVPAKFVSCLFKSNQAPVTTATTASGSGAFVVDDNPNLSTRLESCAFIDNFSGSNDATKNNDGGSAFIANSASTTFFFTNCTFYGNTGSRGAIYLRFGKVFFVNNTVAGNIGYASSTTTSGGMTGGTRSESGIQVTHYNNIFAYNYCYVGTDAPVLRDWSVTAHVYFYGQRNLVGNAKYTLSEGTFNVTNPVPFFYDDPQYEDPLFASYTTTTSGLRVPVLDSLTNTIALAADGDATGKALSKALIADPEIEALIPLTDMRGLTRSTNAPSLGSYEYNVISAIREIASNSNTFIANNMVNDVLILKNNLEIKRMSILNMEGKVICSVIKPEAIISIKVPAGLYLAHFETATGVTTEKLIVKQ